MASSTLVRNNGSSSVAIPPQFGGGAIPPSSSVVCPANALTTVAAFNASNSNGISGNVRFTESANTPPGALPLLTKLQQNGIFVSPAETGTGSIQNIPHNLGVVPEAVTVSATDTTASGIVAGGYVVTESSVVSVANSPFTPGVASHSTITISGGAGIVGASIGGTLVTVAWATSDAASATALITAINANTTVNKLVIATSGGSGVVTVTALAEGTGGNSITLVASGTGISVSGSHLGIGGGTTSGVNAIQAVGHATLSGGSDTFGVVISGHAVSVPYEFPSDDQTAINLVAAINANATVAAIVTATHGTTGVVVLTAVTGGTAGNPVTFTVTGTGASANGAGFLGGTTSGVNAIAATGLATISGGAGTTGVVVGTYPVTVPWATSDAATATALIAAINSSGTASSLVTASSGGAGVVLMTAVAAGTSGNAISLTVYGTGVTVGHSTLQSGAMAYDSVTFAGGATGAMVGASINGTSVTVPWTTSDSATGDLFVAAVAANATANAMVSAVNSSGTVTLTSKVNGSAPDAWTLAAIGGGHNATNLVLTATSGLVFKATAYA